MGTIVPAVTAEQMLELDRIATEEFGLTLLQMMENAGRNLAELSLEMLNGAKASVVVLAGGGGNGGGGLCAARHLHNHGVRVKVILDRAPGSLKGAAQMQLHILNKAGIQALALKQAPNAIQNARLVLDALIGYGLKGSPRQQTAELILLCNRYAKSIVSLDLPSGLNASSGAALGPVVRPERTLTLALPKTGFSKPDADLSELYLADIGIPPEAVRQLGLPYDSPFECGYQLRLSCNSGATRRCRDEL